MRQKPEIVSTRIIAKSRLFQIEEVDLRFANGQERVFERISTRTAGAVMIVPLLDDDTVLLVREYGVGLNDYYLGFPKGIIEAGEDIYAAANRELMEEVGYGAHHYQALKTLASAPGYTQGLGMRVVLATDLYPQKLEGDEPEPIEVVPWQISRLDELLKRDDFNESRSIAALFILREMLHA